MSCALLLGSCADQQETVGPERGVSVGDIQQDQYFYEGDYLGKRVTLSAEVTGVLGPRSIELAARTYGEDSLLVQTPAPVAVPVGQQVRVTGTVGQYHVFADDAVPPVQYDMYEKYETEAYLYEATVEPLPTR